MTGHTPGQWRWEINLKHKTVNLCGGERPKFDLTIMGFRRWGMAGAAPAFINPRKIMQRADEFTAIVPGREHHADWFQAIDHPDANLIAAAPDLLAALDELIPHNIGLGDHLPSGTVIPVDMTMGEIRRARAAIARARGEA